MTEKQKFKVTVYSPVGVRDVDAIGISRVKEARELKNQDWNYEAQVTLEGNVVFQCEDFDYFQTLANSEARYDDVRAVIYMYCDGAWIVKWKTFIEIRKGTFSLDRKTFTVQFSLDNTNRLFDAEKSKTFNIFEIVGERITTSPQYAANLVYQNGVSVYKALLAIFRETIISASITSDFFGWNTAATSYVKGHNQKLQRLTIFHKSDIVMASVPLYSAATIMELSAEEIIGNLCSFMNLRWTMDAAGNFRIEHVSWFSRGAGLDITDPRFTEYLKGTKQFSYDTPKIYRTETFEAPGAVNIDFVGKPIEYDNAMIQNLEGSATDGKSDDDTLKRSVDWITDLDTIYGNIGQTYLAAPDRDESDMDGKVLLALTPIGAIERLPSILEANPINRNNNVLAWAQLHDAFWKEDRIFAEGNMNGVDTVFTAVQRIKKRKTISIPFCCGDTIDTAALVATEFGDALIQKATFDPGRSMLDLDLLYDDFAELDPINPPTATPDFYATDAGVGFNTATTGRPSVLANDIGATSVIAETKDTFLGGSVVISSNGHFVYTPPAGLFGVDVFEYFALNGAGRLDVGRVTVILKTGGIYAKARPQISPLATVTATFPSPPLQYYYYANIIVEFFSDPLGLVPLDVTGYGLSVTYTYSVFNEPAHTLYHSGGATSGINGGSEVLLEVSNYGGFTPGSLPAQPPSVVMTISASTQYTVI